MAADAGTVTELGLDEAHPLTVLFGPDGDSNIDSYLAVDDTVVWDALRRIASSGATGALEPIPDVARRIMQREQPKSIDVQWTFPEDSERQRRLTHQLDEQFKDKLNSTVLRDEASLTLYGEIGADDTKAQKRLMILLPNGDLKEITNFRDAMIKGAPDKRQFLRYYFLSESDHEAAQLTAGEVRGGRL